MVNVTGTGPFGAPGEPAHPAKNANRITAAAIPSRTRNGRIFGTSANSSSARNSGIHRQTSGGAGTGRRVGGITSALVVIDTCACWGVTPSAAVTEDGDTVQVAPVSAPAHARATADLSPPVGVMVTVNMRVFPAFTFWVPAGPVNAKSGAAVPFPLSASVCGLPPALSATDSVPVRAPEAVGVKVTLMEQLAPAAKVAGLVGPAFAPVLVAAHSPRAAYELCDNAAGAVLVFPTRRASVLFPAFTFWVPAGPVNAKSGAAVPFPLSASVCGLPPALSATDSVPVRAPEAVGVKVTLMEQLAPAAKVAGLVGQAFAPVLVAAKSPEAAKELIVKAAVPVLVNVTVIGALVVASSRLPALPLAVDTTSGAAVPFPLSATVCGLPPALSATD